MSFNKTKITKVWCQFACPDDFIEGTEHSNYDWIADFGCIVIKERNGEQTVLLRGAGGYTVLDHIKYIEQVKDLLHLLTGKKLINDMRCITSAETIKNTLREWWNTWHRFAEEGDEPPQHIKELIESLETCGLTYDVEVGIFSEVKKEKAS